MPEIDSDNDDVISALKAGVPAQFLPRQFFPQRPEGAITQWAVNQGEGFKSKLEGLAKDFIQNPEYFISPGSLGIGAAIPKGEIFNLLKQGKTIGEIANMANTSRQYISRLLKDANLTNNPQGFTSDSWRARMAAPTGYPLATQGSIWSDPRANDKLVELFNQGLSPRDISNELGTTPGQVSGRINRINQENRAISSLQEQYGPRGAKYNTKRYGGDVSPTEAAINSLSKLGKSNSEIARELKVSQALVSTTLANKRFVDEK